jgi:alkyl hydroperoxide reductase subunit AhpF
MNFTETPRAREPKRKQNQTKPKEEGGHKKQNPLRTSNMENKQTMRDIVILGTGPAGLTAALYTARANLKPLILHGDTPGGKKTN